MNTTKGNLIEAEAKAAKLFKEIEERGLIVAVKTEAQLNEEIFNLALEMYGIKKYWHKRIVRSGANTLMPYNENPPNLVIQADDILFFDFGPVFEDWEADFGRTYVIGNDPVKQKLRDDIEKAWFDGKEWFKTKNKLTGAELFTHAVGLAKKYGWEFGGPIAGHIVGQFPHERLAPGSQGLYIHPKNHNDMFAPDKDGKLREWILEIHFVDRQRKIGGFFEQLLT